jgi:hypothetical protein
VVYELWREHDDPRQRICRACTATDSGAGMRGQNRIPATFGRKLRLRAVPVLGTFLFKFNKLNGGQGRNRTIDTRIFSPD